MPPTPRPISHTNYQHGGLNVRFAVGYETADELLAELIHAESAPRRLTVVSSDHAVQQAARRRRAKAIDAETWWDQTEQRRRRRARSPKPPSKTSQTLVEDEVAFWLNEFSGASRTQQPEAEQGRAEEPPAKPADLDNPFPPGYGEDLLEE